VVAERHYRQNPWPIIPIVLGLGAAGVGYLMFGSTLKKVRGLIPMLTVAGVGSMFVRPRVGPKMATTIDTISTGLLGVAAFSVLFEGGGEPPKKELTGTEQTIEVPAEDRKDIGVKGETTYSVPGDAFKAVMYYPVLGRVYNDIKFAVINNMDMDAAGMNIILQQARGWAEQSAQWSDEYTWKVDFKPGEAYSFKYTTKFYPADLLKKSSENKVMYRVRVKIPTSVEGQFILETPAYKYLDDYSTVK